MNHYDNLEIVSRLNVTGTNAGLCKPEHDEMLTALTGQDSENINLVFHRRLGAQHRYGVRMVRLDRVVTAHPDGMRTISWTIGSNTFLPMPEPTRAKNGNSTNWLTVPTSPTGIHFQPGTGPDTAPLFGNALAGAVVRGLIAVSHQ